MVKIKKIKGSQKAQFFILGAVILGFAMLSVFTIYNRIKAPPEPVHFTNLAENFEQEATRLINRLIQEGRTWSDIIPVLNNFTYDFIKAKVLEEPALELTWIWANSTHLYFVNFANNDSLVRIGWSEFKVPGGRADIGGYIDLVGVRVNVTTEDFENRLKGEKFSLKCLPFHGEIYCGDEMAHTSTISEINITLDTGTSIEANFTNIPLEAGKPRLYVIARSVKNDTIWVRPEQWWLHRPIIPEVPG